jgi:hypothetical protein
MKVLFLIVLLAGINAVSVAQRSYNVTHVRNCGKRFAEITCSHSEQAHAFRVNFLTSAVINCNRTDLIIHLVSQCTRAADGSGPYCGAATFYSGDAFKLLIGPCLGVAYGYAGCTPECKAGLEDLKAELGCCINVAFNNTEGIFGYLASIFTYRVFTDCGIEPITDKCTADVDVNDIDVINSNSNCSHGEGQALLLSRTCTQAGYNDLRAIIGRDCDVLENFFGEYCSIGPDNEFCSVTDTELYDYQTYIDPMTRYCNNFTNCSAMCRSTLQRFLDERGCCINAVFNSTASDLGGGSRPLLANNSLFTLCGLTPPPVKCPVPFTIGGSLLSTANALLLFLMVYATIQLV